MIFVIEKVKPIKEWVGRVSVVLYEMQGNKRVMHSSYDVAIDLEPHVDATNTDQGVKVNIRGDAIMQELTTSIGAMQLTASIAKELEGVEWQVLSEEEKKQQEENATS